MTLTNEADLKDLHRLLAAYKRKLADPAFPDAPARFGIALTEAAIRVAERDAVRVVA